MIVFVVCQSNGGLVGHLVLKFPRNHEIMLLGL